MRISNKIRRIDIFLIVMKTVPKLIRGSWHLLFFKKSKSFLFVGTRVDITHHNHISIGKNVKFESYSEIHGLCFDGLVFGNNVTIGRNTMIRPSSYYGIDLGAGLIIGNHSSIGPHSYIGCSGKIIIGNNVMIGPKCSLFAENHVFDSSRKTIKNQGVVQREITIEDNCWIGSNVTILDGVTIGEGSVIGAGSLIVKDVAPNSLVIDKRDKLSRSRAIV